MINSQKYYSSASGIQINMTLRLKKLLCTIITITLLGNLYAQDSNSHKLSMGLEIGPSLTTYYNQQNKHDQTKPAIGTTGGLTFQVFINRLISFRSSYLFQLKVEKPKYGEMPVAALLKTFNSSNEHTNFYEFGIPILIQFNVGKKIGFFANIGPNLGFLFETVKVINRNDNQIKKSKNTTMGFDFGVTGGFGIQIPIKERFAVTFEARNNFTLSPLNDNQTPKFYSLDFLLGFSIFNH